MKLGLKSRNLLRRQKLGLIFASYIPITAIVLAIGMASASKHETDHTPSIAEHVPFTSHYARLNSFATPERNSAKVNVSRKTEPLDLSFRCYERPLMLVPGHQVGDYGKVTVCERM